jgi:hypothetical protein
LRLNWRINSQEAAVDGTPGVFTLNANQVTALWKGGEGEFVAAWVIDGERRSNVVKVKVDSKHQVKDEPVLRLTVAEPAVAGRLPMVAVVAARGKESDPATSTLDLVEEGSWTVDGTRARLERVFLGGSISPLAVGKSHAEALALATRGLAVDPKVPHDVAVKVGQISATAVIGVGTPLGDAWDAATAGLEGAAAATRPAPVRGWR